jgi:Ca-activated chloride channel homolog
VIYGKAACGEESVELIAPIGKIKRSKLKDRIEGLSPRGQTPIAFTVNKCPEYFAGFEKENNNLILISDGMESCGGDPVRAIKELRESDANPEVAVIGLGVDSRTKQQLSRMAASSDGTYADVKNEEDFLKAMSGFFSKMSKFYKEIVCINRQYNSYLAFETQQFNKSKSYIMMKKSSASGDMAERLEKLEKQLDQNHEKRVKVKDLLSEMIKNKMEEMDEAIRKFVGR